jgi:SAM-dependent methyltransferase
MKEHERKNRAHWDAQSDEYESLHAKQLAREPMAWGIWSIPESQIDALGDTAGKDVLEFGCGAARWAIALAQRGARVTGLDNSQRQLEHARRNMREADVDIALLHASAENVPLQDESFDIVFCDHGAMTFADPRRTIPEAARLLRRGGVLVFSHETPLHFVCWDEKNDELDTRLHANYFEQHASDDGTSVVFQLPYGEWIRLFRANGFAIEDLIELRAPAGASTTYARFARYEWASRWPAEEIWRLRKQ